MSLAQSNQPIRYEALLGLGRTEVLGRIYKGAVFTAILFGARERRPRAEHVV